MPFVAPFVLLWAACTSPEAAPEAAPSVTAEWQMGDHAGPARACLAAVRAGDLSGVNRAGEALARPERAPGLPDVGRAPLEGVRAGGKALAVASDRAQAASELVSITAQCAACHQALGVAPGGPAAGGEPAPYEQTWTALVFESEGDWVRAVEQLADVAPGLATLHPWADRRGAVGALLEAGKL